MTVMKALHLILGILLILSGGPFLFVPVGVIEGTSEYALGVDIIRLVAFGIGPIIGGLLLFLRRGLP